jgi:hypothetical protein
MRSQKPLRSEAMGAAGQPAKVGLPQRPRAMRGTGKNSQRHLDVDGFSVACRDRRGKSGHTAEKTIEVSTTDKGGSRIFSEPDGISPALEKRVAKKLSQVSHFTLTRNARRWGRG